jgi:two-component system, response regulator / RNA-binding antiterminator
MYAAGENAARRGSGIGDHQLRVLLVDSDMERAAAVRAGLEAAGFEVAGVSSDASGLTRLVRETRADIIVCDLDDPSRDALESMRALNRDEPRPVVVFASRGEPEQIEAALEAGVAAYVVEGLAPARVRPVLEVAIRRFRAHQALRAELDEARATLAERVLIERAKGVLMQRRRLPEADAHRLLRRWAMDRSQRMVEVARSILTET